MSIIPDPYRTDAEGFEHPTWCDVSGSCTAPSALRQRGVAEADVPVLLSNAHLGTARVVDGDRMVETKFTLQAWRMVDQPVTDEVEGIDLHIEAKDGRLKTVVLVTPSQVPDLVEAFADLARLAFPADGDR